MAHGTALRGTALGIVSILVWSTTVPVARMATEAFGVFRASSLILLLGGLFLIVVTSIRNRSTNWVRGMSFKHVIVCGPLFVTYMALLYTAVGFSRSRSEAIAAGLANYLWPTAILIFSVLILNMRAKKGVLTLGAVTALAGVFVSSGASAGGVGRLARSLWPPSLSLCLGILAGLVWGLYSVLAHKYPQEKPSGAVGLYLLAAGIVLAPIPGKQWLALRWDLMGGVAVLFMAIVSNSIAYWLWDTAVRDGNVPALGAFGNLIPVLSAVAGTLSLGVGFRWEIAVGATLVTVGAVTSQSAISSASPSPDRSD